MATYNRSGSLYYSVRSVINQTYQNWELIVVGDCVTDDTETVLINLKDSRIRFYNLPVNHGEQSAPNNFGLMNSKGDYIAFLNHDDFWLADHLDSQIKNLNDSGSDFVFSMIGMYGNFGEKTLACVSYTGYYEPGMMVFASCWFMKRNVVDKIGYWKSYHEIIEFPSEEYIFRAWKNHIKIVFNPCLTVIKIASTMVKNSYKNHDFSLNSEIYDNIINNTKFREEFLTATIISSPSEYSVKMYFFKLFRELIREFSRLVAKIFNINPLIIINFVAYRGGKGKGINALRKKRGLNKLRYKNEKS